MHLYMDRDTASSLVGETKRFKTQIRYIRIPLPLFLSSNKGVVIWTQDCPVRSNFTLPNTFLKVI